MQDVPTIAEELDRALLLYNAGEHVSAEQVVRSIVEQAPACDPAWHVIAFLRSLAGDHTTALDAIDRALAIDAGASEYHERRGHILWALGRLGEAEEAFDRAVAAAPSDARAWSNLGELCRRQGKVEKAKASLLRAYESDPTYLPAVLNLATVSLATQQIDLAERLSGEALRMAPDQAGVHSLRGNVLQYLGELDGAVLSYRRALELDPNNMAPGSNIAMLFHYTKSADEVAREHRQLGERLERKIAPMLQKAHGNHDRVRIGYVSADFHGHSVANFVRPILQHHRREMFEVHCYASVARPDVVTEQFRSLAEHWVDALALDDEALADRVAHDEIDVLIDLGGHTSNNRMGLFARKPAPMQITYLGYPGTTGLRRMDIRLTDALADSEAADALHTERVVRLDRPFLCYAPLVSAEPSMRESGAPLTFGSFNNHLKIGPACVRIWSSVLRAIPESRMVLKSSLGWNERAHDHLRKAFQECGVDAQRLSFLARSSDISTHLEAYRHLDIALDTFPYHGTTTTCEALWLGVPVLTVVGEAHASRVGLSLLDTVGQTAWAVHSESALVEVARELARDVELRKKLRSQIRSRLEQSALMDAPGFVRRFEDKILSLWSGRGPR